MDQSFRSGVGPLSPVRRSFTSIGTHYRAVSRTRCRELSQLVDRLATAADRRTTPRRAVVALTAVSSIAAASLLMVSGLPAELTDNRWIVARAAASPTTTPPPPPREPPRPRAAPPQPSPPAASASESTGPATDGPPQPAGDFTGWAVLDLRTGVVTGSADRADTSTTASMIKVWLVADYLRRSAAAGDQPSQQRLDQLRAIVRDSNNHYAEALYRELGADDSIARLITHCQLTDSYLVPGLWSNTQLSPRDAARMAACLADGRAAGPQWADWLLDEMRAVRGVGDFGIRHAFPPEAQSTIAIKNGWVVRSDQAAWHVNCLAIGDGWTMSVLTRYPVELGVEHGAELCQSLAEQHLPPAPDQATLESDVPR